MIKLILILRKKTDWFTGIWNFCLKIVWMFLGLSCFLNSFQNSIDDRSRKDNFTKTWISFPSDLSTSYSTMSCPLSRSFPVQRVLMNRFWLCRVGLYEMTADILSFVISASWFSTFGSEIEFGSVLKIGTCKFLIGRDSLIRTLIKKSSTTWQRWWSANDIFDWAFNK